MPERLLEPGVLLELWNKTKVKLPELVAYFTGGHTVQDPRKGYDEIRDIRRCSDVAVQEDAWPAVEVVIVWLKDRPVSVWKEQIPYGVLDDDAVLHPRPEPIAAQELVDDALPGAWRDGATNGIALTQALSRARARRCPGVWSARASRPVWTAAGLHWLTAASP